MDSVKPRRELLVVRIFLLLQSLALARAIHEHWFLYLATETRPPRQYAPDCYRVLLPGLYRLVSRDMPTAAASLDFIFILVTLCLLYALAVNGVSKDRVLISVSFLAFLQFALAWVTYQQRSETVFSCLFVAFALYCVSRGWTSMLLGATVFQSFARADIAFVFGAALVLVSLGKSRKNSLAGGGVVAVSGAIQAYLQFVRFKRTPYPPETAVVQLWSNFRPHNLGVFGVAILPFILVCGFLAAKRVKPDSITTLIFVSSGLYLALWFAAGIISEVRIFVPFMLALCVVAAKSVPVFILEPPSPSSDKSGLASRLRWRRSDILQTLTTARR